MQVKNRSFLLKGVSERDIPDSMRDCASRQSWVAAQSSKTENSPEVSTQYKNQVVIKLLIYAYEFFIYYCLWVFNILNFLSKTVSHEQKSVCQADIFPSQPYITFCTQCRNTGEAKHAPDFDTTLQIGWNKKLESPEMHKYLSPKHAHTTVISLSVSETFILFLFCLHLKSQCLQIKNSAQVFGPCTMPSKREIHKLYNYNRLNYKKINYSGAAGKKQVELLRTIVLNRQEF